MTDETVRDTWKHEQGNFVRIREYPMRDKVLRQNAELQKADAVKPTEGLRAFANFPPHELERLAAADPKKSDLVHTDARIRSTAIKKLVDSPEGKPYRVGGTSRKSFIFRNNPLARS